MKGRGKQMKTEVRKAQRLGDVYIHTSKLKGESGITLVALIITTIFSYDENVKSSNNKGFLLATI